MANIVDAVSQGNPVAALSSLYNQVYIQSAITPTIALNVDSLTSTEPSWTDRLMPFLKPTVVLQGPAGRVAVAPYGESGDGTWVSVVAVLGLVGLGFALGRWSK